MDLGGGAVFGGLMVLLALVLAGVYAVARLRTGKAPGHAREDARTGPSPTGDEEVVPREAGGGRPMVTPSEDPAGQSVEDMQQRARRNGS